MTITNREDGSIWEGRRVAVRFQAKEGRYEWTEEGVVTRLLFNPTTHQAFVDVSFDSGLRGGNVSPADIGPLEEKSAS